MKITVAQLKRLRACSDQVELFEATFGASAEVTLENCLRAAEAELDFDWACKRLLNAAQQEAYEAAKASAWKAYRAAITSAWKAYEATEAPAREAYRATEASAREAYEAAITSARKARETAIARAFFEASQVK